MKLRKKDIFGKINFKVKIKKSEPACMLCLPPAPLKGHKILFGIMVHTRIDCPKDVIYMVNDKDFKLK